jgi:hypothetical protein
MILAPGAPKKGEPPRWRALVWELSPAQWLDRSIQGLLGVLKWKLLERIVPVTADVYTTCNKAFTKRFKFESC